MVDNGVENVSICSWEAVDERSGPPSGASSTNASSVLWVPDHAVSRCTSCQTEFWLGRRKHHCRFVTINKMTICISLQDFDFKLQMYYFLSIIDHVVKFFVLIVLNTGQLYLMNVYLHPFVCVLRASIQLQSNFRYVYKICLIKSRWNEI